MEAAFTYVGDIFTYLNVAARMRIHLKVASTARGLVQLKAPLTIWSHFRRLEVGLQLVEATFAHIWSHLQIVEGGFNSLKLAARACRCPHIFEDISDSLNVGWLCLRAASPTNVNPTFKYLKPASTR